MPVVISASNAFRHALIIPASLHIRIFSSTNIPNALGSSDHVRLQWYPQILAVLLVTAMFLHTCFASSVLLNVKTANPFWNTSHWKAILHWYFFNCGHRLVLWSRSALLWYYVWDSIPYWWFPRPLPCIQLTIRTLILLCPKVFRALLRWVACKANRLSLLEPVLHIYLLHRYLGACLLVHMIVSPFFDLASWF